MFLVGFLYFVGNFRYVETDPAVFTGGEAFAVVVGAAFFHLLVSFPDGRLHSNRERLIVGLIYGLFSFAWWARLAFFDPSAQGCSACVPNLNLLGVAPDSTAHAVASVVWDVAAMGLAASVVVLLAGRYRSSSRPARRALGPILLAGVMATVILAMSSMLGLEGHSGSNWDLGFVMRSTAVMIVPAAFVVGIARMRRGRSPMGELLQGLETFPHNGGLRDLLARALGDPGLQLAFPLPDGRGFVDADGRAISLPNGGTSRIATEVSASDGGQLASLIHDPAVLADTGLINAVSSAARLALENEKLHAELRAQLAEVRASRTRIVEAADAERARIERDLHDGAQQRLIALAMGAERVAYKLCDMPVDAAHELEELKSHAHEAIRELRALASGIHPETLTTQGLGSALASLAERSPIPVELCLEVKPEPAGSREVAAYFFCAEALANAAKHANATRATVSVRVVENRLDIEVVDDGSGGAAYAAAGHGLAGLRDRVDALGGTMWLHSPIGHGTKIGATLPAAPPGT